MIRKRSRRKLAVSAFGGAAAAVVARNYIRSLSADGYRGEKSDHFDGKRFHNRIPTKDKRIFELLKWQATSKPGTWRWRDTPDFPEPRAVAESGELLVTFVNHSTVLLQMDGLNILTDPIWSDRASPYSWVGPRRVHKPGIAFEALPVIHAVLVSHNHYDHMDVPTLRRLSSVYAPRIFAGLGNREFLETQGVSGAVDLDWEESVELADGISLTCVPAQHWSTRTRVDLRKTLWCGFVITTGHGSVYFAGDTGVGPHFEEIAERYSPIRLAVLPIGSYLPRWFMRSNHISPAEAFHAHRTLKAQTSLAVHFRVPHHVACPSDSRAR